MSKPHKPIKHHGLLMCADCKAISNADGNFSPNECPGHLVRIPGTFARRPAMKPGPKPHKLSDDTPNLPDFPR